MPRRQHVALLRFAGTRFEGNGQIAKMSGQSHLIIFAETGVKQRCRLIGGKVIRVQPGYQQPVTVIRTILDSQPYCLQADVRKIDPEYLFRFGVC